MRKKSAFTLVELLVVIAIIGILIALLLPAVQAAREAARRSQCTNNLKQLALACHNFHDAHKEFPANNHLIQWKDKNVSGGGGWERWGWRVALLPYVEQQPMYDDMMANYVGTTIRPWTDAAHCNAYIGTFICPSDAQASYVHRGERGPASYFANRGDYLTNWDWYECRGVMGTGFRDGRRRMGIHSFASIKDGSSNTLMLGESKIGVRGSKKVGEAFARDVSTDNGTPPSLCLATVGPDKMFLPSQAVETGGWQVGWRWADSRSPYSYFHTMLPPNGPSCGRAGEDWALITAGSYHPGGCNVALVDGSVRFISETIDAGDPTMTVQQMPEWGGGNPQDYSGRSPYGIWGALGTSSGGEQVSVP